MHMQRYSEQSSVSFLLTHSSIHGRERDVVRGRIPTARSPRIERVGSVDSCPSSADDASLLLHADSSAVHVSRVQTRRGRSCCSVRRHVSCWKLRVRIAASGAKRRLEAATNGRDYPDFPRQGWGPRRFYP